MDLVDETGGTLSGKTRFTASVSIRSLGGVEVPWAFT